MWEFIAKYWIEFVFGIVVAAISAIAKRYHSLYKKGKEAEKKEDFIRIENLISEIDKNNSMRMKNLEDTMAEANQKQNDTIEAIRAGVLDIQKESFMAFGTELLAEGHRITREEYELFENRHEAYNKLGGNHNGDSLFADVKLKY